MKKTKMQEGTRGGDGGWSDRGGREQFAGNRQGLRLRGREAEFLFRDLNLANISIHLSASLHSMLLGGC